MDIGDCSQSTNVWNCYRTRWSIGSKLYGCLIGAIFVRQTQWRPMLAADCRSIVALRHGWSRRRAPRGTDGLESLLSVGSAPYHAVDEMKLRMTTTTTTVGPARRRQSLRRAEDDPQSFNDAAADYSAASSNEAAVHERVNRGPDGNVSIPHSRSGLPPPFATSGEGGGFSEFWPFWREFTPEPDSGALVVSK